MRRRRHLSTSHRNTFFDGVNLRFRKMDKKRRYRLTKMNLRQEAFMQRGMTVVSTKTLGGNPDAPPCIAADPWFVKPWMVEGTSAAAIAPAIEKGQPSSTNFKHIGELAAACKHVTSLTIAKTSDRGGGNQLYHKYVADTFEHKVLPMIPNVLLWLDDCNSHIHHRGKLLLPGMKNHTLKLCSQARHSKMDSTVTTCITRIENRAALLITRLVGPAPDPRTLPASLIIGTNILVQPELKHHDRLRGKKKASM